MGLEPSFN